MNITNIRIKDYTDRVSLLVCLTFPGLLVIDVCFKRGLFLGGVTDTYDLILLLIWGVSLSVLLTFVPFLQFHKDKDFGPTLKKQDNQTQDSDCELAILTMLTPYVIASSLVTIILFKFACYIAENVHYNIHPTLTAAILCGIAVIFLQHATVKCYFCYLKH